MGMGSASTGGRRRGRRSSRQGTFNDINITPLTDVVLVLLIIFMVTAQFIDHTETGMGVNLPTASEVEDLDSLGGIRVRIDRDGLLSVDGHVVEFELLSGALEAQKLSPDQLVIVEGDRETVLQNVVAVMDAAQTAGLPNVVLATAADEPGAEPAADDAGLLESEIEAWDAAVAAPAGAIEAEADPFVTPPTPEGSAR